MERIVVGFDAAEPSFVAIDWVAERAARGHRRVEIVTVGAEDPLPESAGDLAIRDAERRIADRAPGAEVQTLSLRGRMPDALIRAAENADLLVIGAHRQRPVRSAVTGWLPLRTVVRSHIPAVVVPDDWSFNDGPILVGADDDDSSAGAVRFAGAEAKGSDQSLTVLHAWLMPVQTTEGPGALLASPTTLEAAHQQILEQAAAQVTAAQPAVAVEKLLVHDNPSSALLAHAVGASLLVLGTHHRGLIAGAILGSVCQDALWLAHLPVCVVPAATQTA
jgi:nucleotide-binding universal stress UspA family protein